MAPFDLSAMKDYSYDPALATGRFEWVITSIGPLVPPCATSADPDVAGFLSELGHVGSPLEEVVTSGSWSNEYGSWTFASLRTKRKKTRRYYSKIVLVGYPKVGVGSAV